MSPVTHLFASLTPMWIWKGQWALDAWPNRLLSAALFCWMLWLGAGLGHSVVGVFNCRADAVFIGVLRRWRQALTRKMVSKNNRGR
ncbi:MAG: hypothetical protein DME21_07270 [Verrucomicrobia bacterium]|nr:MAG: hypothetical protein DME21_07270 [Verrucomicrobiota bacterium]